jgi:hypothetical protein
MARSVTETSAQLSFALRNAVNALSRLRSHRYVFQLLIAVDLVVAVEVV